MFWLLFLLLRFDDCFAFRGPSNILSRYLLEKHNRHDPHSLLKECFSCAPPDNRVEINYEVELVHIINVDELKQTMQEWVDASLSWDPETFFGLQTTWLPKESIWVPDIMVFNMLEHNSLLHSVRAPVQIFSNGRVVHSYPAFYTVMCTIRIADFPFDNQKCEMRIASWGYGEDKLLLRVKSKQNRLEHYVGNEEWALQGVGIERSHYEHEDIVVSELRFSVSVTRKPLFYMVTLVFPTYIISALSTAGLFARFSTRHERQERFTLGVTAILTMAVLSVVITEKVPHSSEEVPLLFTYFLFNILVVTLATILTSTVMRVHTKGFLIDHGMPPSWLSTLLCVTNDRNLMGITVVVEAWSRLSRRMDHILATITLLAITLPTFRLFFRCAALIAAPDLTRLNYNITSTASPFVLNSSSILLL